MQNKKTLIITLTSIGAIVLIVIGMYFISDSFNQNVNDALYNMTIDYQRMMNGYSIDEIENVINNTQIELDNNQLLTVDAKHIIELNEEFDDEQFECVNHLEVFTKLSYCLTYNPVKNIEVNDKTKKINITLTGPVIFDNDFYEDVNYLDKEKGLLSIKDLKMNDENKRQLEHYIFEELQDYYQDSKNGMDKAKELEVKLYQDIYKDLLKDIVGSSLFTINITIVEEA